MPRLAIGTVIVRVFAACSIAPSGTLLPIVGHFATFPRALNRSNHFLCNRQVHRRANSVINKLVSLDHRNKWMIKKNIA